MQFSLLLQVINSLLLILRLAVINTTTLVSIHIIDTPLHNIKYIAFIIFIKKYQAKFKVYLIGKQKLDII